MLDLSLPRGHGQPRPPESGVTPLASVRSPTATPARVKAQGRQASVKPWSIIYLVVAPRAGGACQPGKAVYLGEGKPLSQTSAALRLHSLMEKASEVNLQEKTVVGVPKAARSCIQLVLAAPATALVPNCNDPIVPLAPPVMWRGGT